jgi:excisionase family DNA binding protein
MQPTDRQGRIFMSELTASQLLTADQLARRWQVPKSQVYRLARDGRLPTVCIGRYYRFRIDVVEAWETKYDRRTA